MIKNRVKKSKYHEPLIQNESNLEEKIKDTIKSSQPIIKAENKTNVKNIGTSARRKSFREKAKKFNASETKKKKITTKKQKIGILSKNKNQEKRQGWWTQ